MRRLFYLWFYFPDMPDLFIVFKHLMQAVTLLPRSLVG